MTQDAVRALNDGELEQVIAWAQTEIKARAERRKQEAIAKIKALASMVGVSSASRGQEVDEPRGSYSQTGFAESGLFVVGRVRDDTRQALLFVFRVRFVF